MTTAATGRLAPALFRRALFVLAGPLAFGAAAAPPNVSPPGGYVLLGSPDQSEGRSVIARFRESGPARPYYLEFILREMPRRGADWSIPGRLWGSRNEAGSVLRIELDGKRPGEARRGFRADPLGIDAAKPRLSWVMEDLKSKGEKPRTPIPRVPQYPRKNLLPSCPFSPKARVQLCASASCSNGRPSIRARW